MVDVDPRGFDAEGEETVALRGQILLIGGASGEPDKQGAHGAPPKSGPGRSHNAVDSGIEQSPDSPGS
jgi:hypothetical protein